MTRTYEYAIDGSAADDQTWAVIGTIDAAPGDFALVPGKALEIAFRNLTQGKAIYGKPGVGCRGPYSITRLLVSLVEV